MYNYQYGYALEVSDCIFIDNEAGGDGGAIYDVDNKTRIVNCVFSGNSAGKRGGGMYECSCDVINCLFVNNDANVTDSSSLGGGGILVEAYPNIIGCTFYGNSAYNGGGATFTSGPDVNNCIFWGNEAVNDGNEIYNEAPPHKAVDFYNCDIAPGGVGGSGGANYYDCIDTNPEFDTPGDPDGDDNKFKTADDGLRITTNSMCKNHGDNDSVNENYDIKGDDRIMQNIVDIGAYEYKP